MYLMYSQKVQSKKNPDQRTDREFSFDVTRNEVFFRFGLIQDIVGSIEVTASCIHANRGYANVAMAAMLPF